MTKFDKFHFRCIVVRGPRAGVTKEANRPALKIANDRHRLFPLPRIVWKKASIADCLESGIDIRLLGEALGQQRGAHGVARCADRVIPAYRTNRQVVEVVKFGRAECPRIFHVADTVWMHNAEAQLQAIDSICDSPLELGSNSPSAQPNDSTSRLSAAAQR